MRTQLGKAVLLTAAIANVTGCRTTSSAQMSHTESAGSAVSSLDLVNKKYCRTMSSGRECFEFAAGDKGTLIRPTEKISFTYQIADKVEPQSPFVRRDAPQTGQKGGKLIRLWFSAGPAATGIRDLTPSSDLKTLTDNDQSQTFSLAD